MLSYLPLRALKRAARKLRRLDPAHVREVAAAIGTLGFCDPLLIGRDNEIIHGEIRFEAALQLGIDHVPCVRIDHLTAQEQRALRLAVNRLAEKGQWDLDALKVELEELILTDAPVEIVGFSGDEIDQILGTSTMGWSRGRSSPIQPPRSPELAISFNSVRIASFVATRLTLLFLLDCWKAIPPPVSS